MKPFSFNAVMAVGVGGVIGTLLRYLLSEQVAFLPFPTGTMVVNLLGSFLLAYVTFHPLIKNKLSSASFTAFTTGLLGSFTTFSTLIMDSFLFSENIMVIASYLGLQIIGGLLFCMVGARLAMTKEKHS